ncbi:MAG TPA: ABC transporter substrate-binding protein [Bradyrhizobium sp.]|jgi:putative ABC transport system substrate-binding protein|nr:ABC transporter substrate-binding protein [Bradyrhizobium sp.]
MKRRRFLGIVGSAAAWPLVTRAQQGKLPTIGLMGDSASGWSSWTAAFVQRLGELGWIEGRNIAIEYRWSEGRPERMAEIAAEFAHLKLDVIVTFGGAVTTFRRATGNTPIVFAIAVDPIGAGLVASLSRPGGNVTGSSIQAADTAGKRLALLREVVPRLRRLAIIFNAGYTASVRENDATQAAARTLGFEVSPHGIRRAEDIVTAFEAIKSQNDALYTVEDALIYANRTQIITLALDGRFPTSFSASEETRTGGLMSYGPSYPALFRRAAEIVEKILRGAKPGDIPVEQPTKFELAINLKTAKALGISVPASILAIADEVIE